MRRALMPLDKHVAPAASASAIFFPPPRRSPAFCCSAHQRSMPRHHCRANGARCDVTGVAAHRHRRWIASERHNFCCLALLGAIHHPSCSEHNFPPPLPPPSCTSSCGAPTITEARSATLWSAVERSAACEPRTDHVLLSAG